MLIFHVLIFECNEECCFSDHCERCYREPAFFHTEICLSTNLNTARYNPATKESNFTAEQCISTMETSREHTKKSLITTALLSSLQPGRAQHRGAAPAARPETLLTQFKRRPQATGKHTCDADQPRWYLSYPKRKLARATFHKRWNVCPQP